MGMSNLIFKSKKCCPKCKTNNIALVEVWSGHTIEWIPLSPGVYDLREGNAEVGNPTHVEGRCRECTHRWKMKKALMIHDVLEGCASCDMCGKTITGKSYEVVNENHQTQPGLVQCEKCWAPKL
jgi:hypothetical protein